MAGPYTGIVQYGQWGATPTPTIALHVTGGEVGPPKSPINHREGVYAQDRMSGGMLEYSGRLDFIPFSENCGTLIEYAVRTAYTSPAMTGLAFEGGVGGLNGWLHTGCNIDTLELAQAVNDPLTASIGWQGTGGSRVAAPSPIAPGDGNPYEWFYSTFTFDVGTFDLQSIRLRLANGIRPGSSLDEKAATSKRKPEFLRVGSEQVSLALVMASELSSTSLDAMDDDAIDVDIDLVWVASNGARKLTITLSDFACAGIAMPFMSPDGDVAWNVELEGKRNNAGTLSIVEATV